MPELTISELVELSGVPARTVRYYQSIGLLAKPHRNGKEAVYTDLHAERLTLIADLRGRGMKLGAIADVLASDAHARNSAADFLGLDALRIGPWTEERDQTCDDEGLSELLGDRREEILDDLIAANYLQFRQGRWHIKDFAMLKNALVLYDGGISVTMSAQFRDTLRALLSTFARQVVRSIAAEAGQGYAGEGTAEDLLQNIDRFRSVAWESAGKIMEQELVRAIEDIRAPRPRTEPADAHGTINAG